MPPDRLERPFTEAEQRGEEPAEGFAREEQVRQEWPEGGTNEPRAARNVPGYTTADTSRELYDTASGQSGDRFIARETLREAGVDVEADSALSDAENEGYTMPLGVDEEAAANDGLSTEREMSHGQR
jgi:hypothetical protein